jgi:hypothetical protein
VLQPITDLGDSRASLYSFYYSHRTSFCPSPSP